MRQSQKGTTLGPMGSPVMVQVSLSAVSGSLTLQSTREATSNLEPRFHRVPTNATLGLIAITYKNIIGCGGLR